MNIIVSAKIILTYNLNNARNNSILAYEEYRGDFPRVDILCPSGLFSCEVPKGDHLGSYFGHSLACGDLDNDGYNTILILPLGKNVPKM